jgi:uncharacterized membrane protein YeaQ/YmgE (transglycosylase-associated protein family)
MEIFLWILLGAAAGWATYKYLGMNEERGILVALAIGATGGLLGGKVVAPMFVTAPTAGEFAGDAMLFAGLVALGVLALGNHIFKRWGV